MSEKKPKEPVSLAGRGSSSPTAVSCDVGQHLNGPGFLPFQVTRAQLIAGFNSQKLVARMIHAGWIDVVRRGKPGREGLYDFRSAQAAYERLKAGEEPPPLPCEVK